MDAAKLVAPLFRGRAEWWNQRLTLPGALLVPDPSGGREDGSWEGAVRLGRPGEKWPRGKDGRPLTPVLQMDMSSCPFKHEELNGVRLLTLFCAVLEGHSVTGVYLGAWDEDAPEHGEGWCVRTYAEGEEVVPLEMPEGTRTGTACAMKWQRAMDVPKSLASVEVCNASLPVRFAHDEQGHKEATKVGGWPTDIQGGPGWRPLVEHADAPQYVFQSSPCRESNLMWGDAGCAYVGIRKDGGWVIAVECY
jgi:hypothetical protein